MFSWLTGGSGKGNDDKKPSPANEASIASLGSTAGTEQVDMSTPGMFDPSVLERIAKAAEALKAIDNASELIGLAQQQELSWQEKFRASQAEATAKAKEADAENIKLHENERRLTAQHETEQQGQRAKFQDDLARQRYQDQLQQQQQMNERERQLQEQAALRQEQERRRTVEYEAELRRQTELAKAQVDAEARIKQERENADIRKQQLLLQATENRTTVLEGIKTAGKTVGDGITDFLQDPTKVTASIGLLTGIALGVYSARAGTNVASQYLQRRLSKPPLIRETSRKSLLLNPWASLKSMVSSPKGNPLEGMVLNGKTEEQLANVTISTANTRSHGANFRHLMLYGPPGTGKTMFGRRLAQQSGLEYAVLAGGDVGPLGTDAVTEIHKVFDWAETSKKGLLLFVDEADAFLRKRGSSGDGKMSEETRNALSTFLYRTGDPTNKFMLVFSTNEPEAFDRAVTDRVDEAVELGLPSTDERRRLLELYFDSYVRGTGLSGSTPVVVHDDVDTAAFGELAGKLEGFSGRQIAKLCAAWQATANASSSNILNKEMMAKVVDRQLEQLKVKDQWAAKKIF
eukprot:m.24014 g.24014  ORF g.24014 m.24014 type:complete len:575 (-) comp11464_c0_seq1:124-1848(-)